MSLASPSAGIPEPGTGVPTGGLANSDLAAAAGSPWHQRAHVVYAVLFVILSLALALRLYGINWDDGGLFHPDERAILSKVSELDVPSFSDLPDLLDADKSTLNPAWFSYGSLPLYMLKSVDLVASPFTEWNVFDLRFPGRVMSAMADTALIGLIFLFGRAWLGNRVGLLAALFAALAVIEIQLSHFFAVDTFLALFGAAAVFFMVRVAYTGNKSDSLAAGVLVGLALATKASASVLLAPLIFSHLVYVASEPGEFFELSRNRDEIKARARAVLTRFAFAGAGIIGALYITQPYMFLDWDTYRESVSRESEMVRRITDLPFTRQYIDTPKYFYQFWQLGTYGLGPVLGMLAWGSLLVSGIYALRKRRKFDLVVLSYLVPYLLITGWFEVKFLRYMLPALPFLLLYAARLLIWGLDIVRDWRPDWRYAGPVAIGLVVAATAHYAISYETIYSRPHPAQATSDWIIENTPRDSLVLKEHWEEGLPRLQPRFREELELYNPDADFKFDRISSQLGRADYLVFYSNRLFATLPRLEERYPVSIQYYEKLFDGSLGYDLVHTEQSVPSSFGISYDEDTFGRTDLGEPAGYEADNGGLATISFGWADESFYVYDHPKTLVFQNTGRLGAREIFDRIHAEVVQQEPVVGLLLSDDKLAAQRAGGTISGITDFGTGTAGVSWIIWLLAAQVIGFLALPLGYFLFKPLAGRGYLLTKVLGLLIVSFLAWFMASVGIMDFSRGSVLFSMLVLGAVSAVILMRNWDELSSYYRENRRLILIMEAIFLTTFFVFLFIRMANPDLWHPFRGGEKPMDFAYLNAVTRSTVMPPFDPWFSGGFLNYYYFGQFVVAMMIRLTGIETAIAYNLAIPLLFAMTAGAIFSIVYALTEGARTVMAVPASLIRAGGRAPLSRGPVLAGIGGIVLILVAGNLDGLVQVFQGANRALFQDQPFGTFDFWRSSRMFAAGSPGNEITEFPFFTFLFADLHAHLIAIPFTLLALGLGISVFFRILSATGGFFEQWGSIIFLGLAIGALRIINAWDWPTYLALGGGAIVAGHLLASNAPLQNRLIKGAAMGLVMLAVSHLAYLPFHVNFELFNDEIERSQFQTPLWRYWYVHAPFILLILSYIAWQAWAAVPAAIGWLGISGRQAALFAAIPVAIGLALGFAGYGTLAFTGGVALAVLALMITGIAAQSPRLKYELVIAGMVVVALGIGGGVDLVTVSGDIGRMNTVFKFYLQAWILMGLASSYIAWRFASSGAFSLRGIDARAWLGERRWSTALAFATAQRLSPYYLISVVRFVSRPVPRVSLGSVQRGERTRPVVQRLVATLDPFRLLWVGVNGLMVNSRRVWAAGVAMILIGVLIYPVMGTQVRLRDRFNTGKVTLNGLAYMEDAVQFEQGEPIRLVHDLLAINWLQKNVKGSPVIVEGLTDLYHLGNRVSINTGLPAVIGWDWHQRQQRVGYADAVTRRRADVDRIYTTADPNDALRLMRKYDVRYLYLGKLERVQYPEEGIAKFESMDGLGLFPVYINDEVTIYELIGQGVTGAAAGGTDRSS